MNVFLSRPSWVPPEFDKGLSGFLRVLEGYRLRPRTIGTTDFPSRSPLDEVIKLMEKCVGAIILGYPQIEVRSGFIKDKKIDNSFLLGTEWNHIEASLAYAMRVPLLVIHHTNVVRGIFDRGAINGYIYSRDLIDASWPLSPEISGALKNWVDSLAGSANDITSGELKRGGQVCPNCSSRSAKVFLSPIPPDFLVIENANYECNKCGYKK